jgi:hypothetical protein
MVSNGLVFPTNPTRPVRVFYAVLVLSTTCPAWAGVGLGDSESSIESSLHQMRSRIRSVFISSPAADQAAMSVNQWESAPMKKRSFRPLAAQLALGVGAWLCLMLALAQSHGSNAADIYLLADVTPLKTSTRITQFGKIDSTTGVFTQITADVSNGFLIGNPTWNPTANAFYVTSENVDTGTVTLNTLDTSGTLSGSIGTLAANGVLGMAYNMADSSLYAYESTRVGITNALSYAIINPATAGSTVLTTLPTDLGAPETGIFAIHQGTLYSSQTRLSGAGQFGSYGFTAGSNYQQIGSDNSNFANMSLASDGSTLFGVHDDGSSFKLFTINPATGALSAGINITGMSSASTLLGVGAISVPEPGTCMLALIGAAMLAAKARLRRRRAQLA